MSFAAFISDLHASSPFFRRREFLRFAEWLADTKIKYLFIAGDLCSHRTGLDDTIRTLSCIPKNITVYAIPGNHDPVSQKVPQPALKEIESVPNVVALPNPAYVELEGRTILMYHGQGMDQIKLPAIEKMCYMIETKALVPGIVPIKTIPDIFHTGHIHIYAAGQYGETLLVNAGTWVQKYMFAGRENICNAVIVDLETLRYRKYTAMEY